MAQPMPKPVEAVLPVAEPGNGFIPYGRQWIDAEDEAAVLAVLRSPMLTQGPAVAAFEKDFAAYVGARFAVAVSNATAGLHLAMLALECGPGEGITSPNTFVATPNAMAYAGLTPRFADIDPDTLNITPERVRPLVNAETRVIAPVHFAGLPADMEGFAELAAAHGVALVEDAAHAVGSEYRTGGRVGCGRFAAMTVFSFHPVKTMTTGEGGAVTTNDDELWRRLSELRSHGITRDPARMGVVAGPWAYEQQALGFNYRMTDVQAALGSSQLRKLDRFAQRRRAIGQRYRAALGDLPWLRLPHDPGAQGVCHHLFVVHLDFAALGRDRQAVMAELAGRGVGTQVHYIPVHTQPWYRETYGTAPGDCPNAEAHYATCLSLPLFAAMGDGDVERVIEAVRGLA